MLADYQFNLYSVRTGDLLMIYDARAVYEVAYSRALNDVGVFAMTLIADDSLDALFEKDNLIDVLRTHPITGKLAIEDTYLVRITDRLQDQGHEFYIVGGVSLNHLIGRRVVDPDDDAAAAGGYSTKAGAADSVMRQYALEQMGSSASADRQLPNFTVATVPGVGQGVGERLRYENLLDVFQRIAERTDVDFRIRRISGNNLELQIGHIGADRTQSRNYPFAPFVQIDPLRGNLSEPRLTRDSKEEKNYVYAKARGPGDSRIVFQSAGATTGDSPLNRVEFAIDARNVERGNALEIISQASAALAENEPMTDFSFSIRGDEPGNTYRQDWDLGDTITARWGDFSQDLRITEVEISLSEENETIQITTEVY